MKSRETRILESNQHPIKKIAYKDTSGISYYGVSFLDFNDNSINVCASSQIGCIGGCKFCATGDQKFIRNLNGKEILNEFIDGFSCFDQINGEDIQTAYIVMEGMGEPSYNLDNIFHALIELYPLIEKKYKTIFFKISTIGNIDLVNKYIKFIKENRIILKKIKFQCQVSLHNSVDRERRLLIPNISQKYSIGLILDSFYKLSDYLDSKLKCNYLLLNYPDGKSNYSQEHLNKLAEIVDPKKITIKLTKYSDTGKGFSSPSQETYEKIKSFLESKGIETGIREIYGDDLGAACGMLRYEMQRT